MVQATVKNLNTDESYDVSSGVLSVAVRKRFLRDSFPLFVVNLQVTEEMRDILRDNDITLGLKIQSYPILDNMNLQESDTVEPVIDGIVYEGFIRIYDKPFDTTVHNTTPENDDEDNSKALEVFRFSLTGIPEELIEKNEKIVNSVFKQAECIDALIHTITSIDSESEISIQNGTNREVFKNIIVPPLNLIPALKFLMNTYRLFDNTAFLFYDYLNVYIYSPFSSNIEYKNTLSYTVLNSETNNNLEDTGVVFMDSEDLLNMEVKSKYLPEILEGTKIISHATGNSTTFSSYDENFNLVTREASNTLSYNKERFFWNDLRNQGDENAVLTTSQLGTYTNISLNDVDPSKFTPLTNVKIAAEEYPSVSGDYIISECSYIFTTRDYKYFSNTLYLSCIKVI